MSTPVLIGRKLGREFTFNSMICRNGQGWNRLPVRCLQTVLLYLPNNHRRIIEVIRYFIIIKLQQSFDTLNTYRETDIVQVFELIGQTRVEIVLIKERNSRPGLNYHNEHKINTKKVKFFSYCPRLLMEYFKKKKSAM